LCDGVSELAVGLKLRRLEILVEGGLLGKLRMFLCIGVDDACLIDQ